MLPLPLLPTVRCALPACLALALAACGGGGGSGASNAPAPVAHAVPVSAASALPSGCGTAVGNASATPAEAFALNSAVQPQLAADPATPAHLVGVWEQDRWNAIGTRAINAATSTDGGASWSAIRALPFSVCGSGMPATGLGAGYDRASDPSIAVGPGGVLLASALAFSAGGYLATGGKSAILFARSSDGGLTWSTSQSLWSDTGTGTGPYYFNDRDAIAADPHTSNVYVVWDRLIDNTHLTGSASMPTWLAQSGDGGVNWSGARVIYDPGPGLQTFNNQPLVLPDGTVLVLFSVPGGFAPTLAAIRSTDHGATWTASGSAITVGTVDSAGTQNPITGGPAIRDSSYMAQTAVDPVSGTVAAVWQDSSFSSAARDGIALTLSTDKGLTWSTKVQVNTQPGVAAFNPAVHFGSNGRLAVTYYDFRDYVSGSAVLATSLWLRESLDGGKTWTETRLAGPFDLNQAPPADRSAGSTGSALFLGDQQGLAWNGSAWVALDAVGSSTGAAGTYTGVSAISLP